MIENFDEILLELSYRVPEGIVDLTKDYQVTELVNILRESGVDDAFEIAQKARVYFSYLNEATRKKPKQDIDTILQQKFKNPETGNDVTVASALGYDKNTQAYNIANRMFTKAGYSDKDIDMVDAGPDDEEQPQANVFGKDKGGNVFEPEKKSQPKDPKVVQKQAKEIAQKIYGKSGKGPLLQNSTTSDAALKNGYQEGTWWVAPGNAGSNFNENMSDEGAKILEKYNDLDEETLAMIIFNKTKGTALGNQQKDVAIGSKNKINVPPTISKEDAALYKNAVIAARSARQKHNRAVAGVAAAQKQVGFGNKIQRSTHGGTSRKTDTPKNVQTDRENILSAINKSKKCFVYDSETNTVHEIDKEFLIKWVNSSGGGENAADTLVISMDEKGNLLYDGWSDKKTLKDLQGNGTINNDMTRAEERIDVMIKNGQLEGPAAKKAKAIVQDGKNRIKTVEKGYKTVAGLQSKYFNSLDDKTLATIEKFVAKDKETAGRYSEFNAIVKTVLSRKAKVNDKTVAIAEQISGVKRKKSKEEIQAEKYIQSLLDKYEEEDVPSLVKNENIKPEEIKAIKKALEVGKVGKTQYLQQFNEWLSKNKGKIKNISTFKILNGIILNSPDSVSSRERQIVERASVKERERLVASGEKIPKNLNTQKVLEAMRKEALDLQRDVFKQLDKLPAKTASGQKTTAGNLLAYEDAKDFLHLDKIDLPKNKNDYHQMMKRNTELTMEGIEITPKILKHCLGVKDTAELQDHFVVGFDDERYQKNDEGYITGKVICLYMVDKNGKKREISPKTFRPKQGPTAPTANTVSWSTDMQNCFDSSSNK